MGAKQWEKPPSGPDWMDCFAVMRSIEESHSVLVTVCFTSTVYNGPAGITVIAAYSMGKEGSVMGTPVLAMSGEYPCPLHGELSHCIYAGLLQLDTGLSTKLWEQSKLPFTAE
jgi:hypothetical protein